MFGYLIVALIAAVAVIALMPKPPGPSPASLDDFAAPTAEEGREIPVVFGTRDITGFNLVWYGDLAINAHKKKGMFGSSTTVGFFYRLGMHMILCHGPIDKVTQIDIGDKNAWAGDSSVGDTKRKLVVTSGGVDWVFETPPPDGPGDPVPDRIFIDKGGLFGGSSKNGGVMGHVTIARGEVGQDSNDYLEQVLDVDPALTPAFRGVAAAIIEQAYIGKSTYLNKWRFTVQRLVNDPIGNPQWYPTKAIIGPDMNPVHIIVQVLTSGIPDWGLSFSLADIDEANFQAAADTLFTENFGLSFLWTRDMDAGDFIGEVLRHIDGKIIKDRATGKLQIKLIRPDYDPNTVRVLGTDTVLNVEKLKTSEAAEMANQISVKYWNRVMKGPGSVTMQNLALIDMIQGINAATIDYPGCCNETLANVLAARDLKAYTTPLTGLTIVCNKRVYDLQEGDPVKLDIEHENVPNVVYRVIKVEVSKNDKDIKVQLLQDVFSMPAPTRAISTPRWQDLGSDPVKPTYYMFYEASYRDACKGVGEWEVQTYYGDQGTWAAAMNQPTPDTYEYSVYLADRDEYLVKNLYPSGFGVIQNALSKTDTILNFQYMEALDDMLVGETAIIGNNAAGEERVKIDSIDGTSITVTRGVEDTLPLAHAAGTQFTYVGDEIYVPYVSVRGDIDAWEEIRFPSVTTRGGQDPADAITFNLLYKGRVNMPYPPANIRIGGQSDPATLTVDSTVGLSLNFSGRNRISQYDTLTLLGWYDATDLPMEANTTIHYRVKDASQVVVDSGNVAASGEFFADMTTASDGVHTVEMWAERDGLASFQTYSHAVDITITGGVTYPTGDLVTGYVDMYFSGTDPTLLVGNGSNRSTDWFTLPEAGGQIFLAVKDPADDAGFNRITIQTRSVAGDDATIALTTRTGYYDEWHDLPVDAVEARVYFTYVTHSYPNIEITAIWQPVP